MSCRRLDVPPTHLYSVYGIIPPHLRYVRTLPAKTVMWTCVRERRAWHARVVMSWLDCMR